MSVSNVARRRGTILDEIMHYHRQELPKTMRAVPLAGLRALANVAPPPLAFTAALQQPGVSLIAECKKASPTKGLLVPHYDPVMLAESYARAGAAAVSVLTDARHFQGSLNHLRDVKEFLISNLQSLIANKNDPRRKIGIPVLRKDFIFHAYQVYEARAAGADGILLIAAVLSDTELRELLELAHRLGMNALIEIHTEAEVARVLPLKPRIVGVNNRDLQTFEIEFENAIRLRRLIPADILVVGESGIQSAEDVVRLRAAGVNAVLVGESLVRRKDPQQAARVLVEAGR